MYAICEASSLAVSQSTCGVNQLIPGQTVLDLTIDVPHTMLVSSSHDVEHRVRDAIMSARREVREVKIHVHAHDGEADLYSGKTEENGVKVIKSDFGQDGCKAD